MWSGFGLAALAGRQSRALTLAAALGTAREGADTSAVVTYRAAHSWAVYPIAVVLIVTVFEAFAGVEGHLDSTGEWCVAIVLTATGVATPAALILWNRSLGVRVSDAGIVSVGLNSAEAIGWRDISRFFVDDRGSRRIGVYAGMTDGSRVALYALAGRRGDRQRLDQVCDVLSRKLRYEQARVEPQPALPSFAGVPFGWRRRLHGSGALRRVV